jgi:predicted small integral membrane protein
MIRYLKIFLVVLVALWGLIGAMGNLAKPEVAYEAVHSVTTMPAFEAGEAPPWATENPVVIWLGVALIVLGKLAALVFCGWGAMAMLRAVRVGPERFQAAKRWAVLGCGLALASLFGGFVVIGEMFYLMFMDPGSEHAAAAAFRYGGFIALILIFVAQEE